MTEKGVENILEHVPLDELGILSCDPGITTQMVDQWREQYEVRIIFNRKDR